jgi:hypothetical protein
VPIEEEEDWDIIKRYNLHWLYYKLCASPRMCSLSTDWCELVQHVEDDIRGVSNTFLQMYLVTPGF